MTRQQKFLLIIAPVLVVGMIILCYYSTTYFGKTTGYILTNAVYWLLFCVPSAIYITKGKIHEIHKMFASGIKSPLYNIASFVPVLATCAIVFIPVMQVAPAQVIIIAFAYAIINGFLEELFWRGLFNVAFKSVVFACIYPTVMFSCWHIALSLAQGMVYTGGSWALIGGASFMGLLWGIVAFKTKSVKYTTIAHVLTNCFAFSGLIYENWFLEEVTRHI